jgi:predicted Zn-dependent protease
MTLQVVPATEQIDAWTAFGGVAPDVQAVDDLKRGLSAEAQGADEAAERFYAKALSEGPTELKPLDQLAGLLARTNKTDRLAALSDQPLLTEVAASPKTLLSIAQAMTKSGNPKGVVRMLDAQMKLQPPTAELYRALADACEATGDKSRAHDLRALAAGVAQNGGDKN